ncbi:MAG: hypothetical protein QM765_28500 [Myxococcales bacterium]
MDRDGIPELAPRPRTGWNGMTPEQLDQADAIAFLKYKQQIAERMAQHENNAKEAEAELEEAKETLAELERQAGFAAVPFEWRR